MRDQGVTTTPTAPVPSTEKARVCGPFRSGREDLNLRPLGPQIPLGVRHRARLAQPRSNPSAPWTFWTLSDKAFVTCA